MATSNLASRYRFFQNFSPNTTFVETFLLPELAKLGRYTGTGQGIQLPHAQDTPADQIEYLPLAEAAALAIDYLAEHNHLGEQEITALRKLAGNGNFTHLANLLQLLIRERVTNPQKLLSTRLTENVITYQQSLADKKQLRGSERDYLHDLKLWNELRQNITRLTASGASAAQIKALLPHNIHTLDGGLTQTALTSFLLSQLPELVALAQINQASPELAARAQLNHLERSINTAHPELIGLHNFLPAHENSLPSIVIALAKDIGTENLQTLSVTRERAAHALTFSVAGYHDLSSRLNTVLIDYQDADRAKVTATLLATLTSSHKSALTSQDIVTHAARTLGLSQTQTSALYTTLSKTGLAQALEFHQNELHLQTKGNRLVRGEKTLLARGVNPFQVFNTEDELAAQARSLLNLSDSTALPTDYRKQLVQLFDEEKNSPHPNRHLLTTLNRWLDQDYALSAIGSNPRLLRFANRARSQREFLEMPLAEKWLTFEDAVTGRRLVHRALKAWDNFAGSKAVIPLTIRGKKVHIPLFRLSSWGLDQWYNFKKNLAIQTLKNLRGTTNPFGKVTQFSLRHYLKGDLTWGGAFYSGSREIWSKRIVKPLVSWSLTKLSSTTTFKYLAPRFAGRVTNVVGRTATRFLIKLGGKALAKTGGKAITALLAAGTVVGSVISAILAASLIFDLLGMAYDFLKELLHNPALREKILVVGGIFTAFFTFGWLAPLGLFLAGIGVLVLQTLLVAGAVALGLLISFNLLYSSFSHTIELDSAPAQMLLSLVCDMEGNGDNPRVNAAICINEILSDAGLNPLSGSDINSPLWQQVVTALAGSAIEALSRSAIDQAWLQCVGLIAAVIGQVEGVVWDPPDANQLPTLPPPGYRYAAGAGSCQPGDFFVMTGGTYGHTGIIVQDGGPYFLCVDANGGGNGVIRGPDSCTMLKSEIAGCLKPI